MVSRSGDDPNYRWVPHLEHDGDPERRFKNEIPIIADGFAGADFPHRGVGAEFRFDVGGGRAAFAKKSGCWFMEFFSFSECIYKNNRKFTGQRCPSGGHVFEIDQ